MHQTIQARRALVAALGEMLTVRANVRGVYWGECTVEARPLARLDRESRDRLEIGIRAATKAAMLPKGLRAAPLAEAIAGIEAAWMDTHNALGGWGGVPCQLAAGDAAMDEAKAAADALAS